MKKSIPGFKDSNGVYTPIPKEPEVKSSAPELPIDVSIDDLLRAGLQNIRGAMISITSEINMRSFDRDTIQNLKDLMNMLKDLKKEEKEFLDTLSDADLQKLSKK